jgi:hypothetical protein
LVGSILYIAFENGKYLSAPDTEKGFSPLVVAAISAFWIPAGAVFGVWAEFTFRTGSLSYERLFYSDPERWLPIQRFLIAIMIAYMRFRSCPQNCADWAIWCSPE